MRPSFSNDRSIWVTWSAILSRTLQVLLAGRDYMRVRSRGLPRKRNIERKWGIMTVAIRRLLMVSGAGDWPAKALSPALGLCVSIVPATECLRPPHRR